MPQISSITRKHKNEEKTFCPHCNNKTLTPEASATSEAANLFPHNTFVIRRCNYCKKLSFAHSLVVLKSTTPPIVREEQVIHSYPSKNVTEVQSMDMPQSIKNDYIEALKNIESSCFKSACVMLRRALQNASLELGADSKKTLENQIDELSENGIIPKDLKDWAHEIRIVGNKGAHPLTKEFDDINKNDAIDMRDFFQAFVDYIFVLKKRFEKRTMKKEKK